MDHHEEKACSVNAIARLILSVALGLILTARADEFGRLFFSPDERRLLDQQRARQMSREGSINIQAPTTVNGLIRQSDGCCTVWINGKARHIAPGKNTNSISIILPGKDESIEVKVGQHLWLDNLPANNEPSPIPQKVVP